MPKGRGGRGTITNALLLCNKCHIRLHKDNKRLEYWINKHREMYGKDFYKDEFDKFDEMTSEG